VTPRRAIVFGVRDVPSFTTFMIAAVAFALFAIAVRTPWRQIGFKRRARVAEGEAARAAVALPSEEAARAWVAELKCACGRAAEKAIDPEPIVVGARRVTAVRLRCTKCSRERAAFYYVDG